MSTNFQVSFVATPSFMQQHPLYQYCTVKQITPLGPNRFGIFFSSWQDGLNFAAECAQRGIVSNTFPGKHKTVQSSPDGRSFVALLDYEIDSFVRNPRQSWVIATHVPDFIPSAQTLPPQQLFSPPRHQPALKFTASKASFIPSSVQQTPHPIKSFASIAASSSAPPSIQAQAATSIKTAQSSVEKKGEISRGTIFYEKNGKKLFIVSNDYPTSGELPFEKFKAIFDSGWDCHHVVKGLLEGGRVKKINTTRAIDDDVTKFCSKLLYAMGLKDAFGPSDLSLPKQLTFHHLTAANKVDQREGVIGSITQERIFRSLPDSVKKEMEYEAMVHGFSVDMKYGDHIIIEIDGTSHGNPLQMKKDEQRDTKLEALGYKIFRVSLTTNGRIKDYVNEIIQYLEPMSTQRQGTAQPLTPPKQISLPKISKLAISASSKKSKIDADEWKWVVLHELLGDQLPPLNVQISKVELEDQQCISMKIALPGDSAGRQKFYSEQGPEVGFLSNVADKLINILGPDEIPPFLMVTPFINASRWFGNSKRGIRLLFTEEQMRQLPTSKWLDMDSLAIKQDSMGNPIEIDISDYSNIFDYIEDRARD